MTEDGIDFISWKSWRNSECLSRGINISDPALESPKTICLQGLHTQNSEHCKTNTAHLSTVKIYPHTSNNEESSESRSKLHNLNISFKVNGLLLNSQNHDSFEKQKYFNLSKKMLFTISTWILLIKIRQYGNKLQLYLWVHISYDLMTVLKHCKELAISSCSVLTTKIKLMPKHNKQKLLCVGLFVDTFLSIPKI